MDSNHISLHYFLIKASFFEKIVQYLLMVLHFGFFEVTTDFRSLFYVSIVADLIGYWSVCFDIFEVLLLDFLEISYVSDASVEEVWRTNVSRHGVVLEFSLKEFDFPYQFFVVALFQRMFVFGVFFEYLKLCFRFLP